MHMHTLPVPNKFAPLPSGHQLQQTFSCMAVERSQKHTMPKEAESKCQSHTPALTNRHVDVQQAKPLLTYALCVCASLAGINLTSANYVFLLEPSMNPALEDQAIGRAWRMGQARPVTVKKLYVKVRSCLMHSILPLFICVWGRIGVRIHIDQVSANHIYHPASVASSFLCMVLQGTGVNSGHVPYLATVSLLW